jgi:hypothetical protein
MDFTDVQPSDYFYEALRYLYCRGIVSGYADGTFRPYNNTTRAQLTKMVVLGEGWTIVTPQQPTFSDVLPGDTFYGYIETAVQHETISGYADGTFRPFNSVTRAQLTKIIVLARDWTLVDPPIATFADVPIGSPFFEYVETAAVHDIISGYADGTFRPWNNATRGQIAKVLHSALTMP